jgi:zinc transport system substrate-binding protein
MKNLKVISLILLIAAILLLFFMSNKKDESNSKKPIVAVTTFALYDIVTHIAKDSVEIVHILPFGVDPHSFEPTPKLMAKIEESALVFYSGAGLEPWVDGFDFHAKAINIGEYVHLRKLSHNEAQHHKHHHSVDPHYWLDFENMKIAAKVITKNLIALLPKREAFFKENLTNYIAMLQKLENEYAALLGSCKLHKVVVSHNALGYLSRRYHFDVESLTGLSPEAQPSAKEVTSIMNTIKKDGVRTIFFEHFVNDNVIKRIAADTNISIDVFEALGNITKDEAEAGMSYEDLMRKNLQKLSKALMCQ